MADEDGSELDVRAVFIRLIREIRGPSSIAATRQPNQPNGASDNGT